MVQPSSDKQPILSFPRLMRLGQIAHSQGDLKQAHDYWRKAAVLEPTNEEVWTALMWVLESDEDRKVCLKNILSINPQNLQAQEMLDELIGDTQADERIVPDIEPLPERDKSYFFGLILLRLIQVLAVLAFIALAFVLSQFIPLA